MHLIQINTDLTIQVDGNGDTAATDISIKDFDGLIKLGNPSTDTLTVTVTVTETLEDMCPPPATVSLAGGQSYYLPVDATNVDTTGASTPTAYSFAITNQTTNASGTATLTIDGYVGSPKVDLVNGQLGGWNSCRHNGAVAVRSTVGTKLKAWFDSDSGNSSQLNANSTTVLTVPAGATSLNIWGKNEGTHSIDLIDQSSPAMVVNKNASGELIATTRAVALADGDTLTLAVANATNTATDDGADIEVELWTFASGQTTSIIIPAPLAGNTATLGTVTLDSTVAWLNVGYPSTSGGSKKREIEAVEGGGEDDEVDSGTSGTDLGDDPVVIVKHTGCGG